MKSRTLNKSDIKDLNAQLQERYTVAQLSKKDLVQIAQGDHTFITVNGEIRFVMMNDIPVPTLKHLLTATTGNFLKSITVDMGAIKFLCGGADLMRPGITEIDEDIEEGDIVSIIDDKNKKPIMVGRALYDTQSMREQEQGKSVANLHHVGDDIWNAG